jgi:putative aminopeptidase
MKKATLFILGFLLCAQVYAQTESQKLLSLLHSFSKTSAVSAREKEAAEFVQSLFSTGSFQEDAMGNLVMVIGSGSPRRLFAAPLDEPGYAVTEIEENGYLRISPVGYGHFGPMFHQFLQGNEVVIGTDKGPAFASAIIPSLHFELMRAIPEVTKSVYSWQETFIDAGVNSSKEVAERGIQLLDPLTTNKRPQIIGNNLLAAPSARAKASVVALAMVAKTLLSQKVQGTTVIAFTTQELLNFKGIETVNALRGPFDQIVLFNRFLTEGIGSERTVLSNKSLPGQLATRMKQPDRAFEHPVNSPPEWDTAKVFELGLPANYVYTPIEMVHIGDVEQLIQTWLRMASVSGVTAPVPVPKISPTKPPVYTLYQAEHNMMKKLVDVYAVCFEEKPMRDFITSALPAWAKPVTDERGNLSVSFGKGKQHIAFVAHMDEVGYVVDSILNDGRLAISQRGVFFNITFEGQAASIVTENKKIAGVFEPREDYLQAKSRFQKDYLKAPIVYAGFRSREEALAAGIIEGHSQVLMPKQLMRLSQNRASAKGFDDRVGCAALLLALKNLNPETVPFKVTFIFSMAEEVGLVGTNFAAKNYKDLKVVYPIDTYVSTDDPVEDKIYGNIPLGNGAVLRVLETVVFSSRESMKYLQSLASKNNIKLQYGMSAGFTDGQPFMKYGIPSVPLSWPGRYSHSPVEFLDYRDLQNLTQLIKAIVLDKSKVY